MIPWYLMTTLSMDRMWNSIVSGPNHCLFIYFVQAKLNGTRERNQKAIDQFV